jgi:hypothetical protein
MRIISVCLSIFLFSVASAVVAAEAPPLKAEIHPSVIEQDTGMKGELNAAENVFTIRVPRSDLRVFSGTAPVSPIEMVSWAGFTPSGSHMIVLGSLVVAETQVNPVMSAALDNGLEVTALHNQFMGDGPRVMNMSIQGAGSEEAVAKAVGAVFKVMQGTGSVSVVAAPAVTDAKKLHVKKIEEILNFSGQWLGAAGTNEVFEIVIGRSTRIGPVELGRAMGVGDRLLFSGTDGNAVVEGDFVALEPELRDVLKIMRHGGFVIMAVHNRMTGEAPRVIFVHFRGQGKVLDLARTLRSVLDGQSIIK